jgi:hypothetical protein
MRRRIHACPRTLERWIDALCILAYEGEDTLSLLLLLLVVATAISREFVDRMRAEEYQ